METYHANLPEKAMEKYHRITDTVSACGYETNQYFRGTDGIYYWFFSRNVPTARREPFSSSLRRMYRRGIYLLWEQVR